VWLSVFVQVKAVPPAGFESCGVLSANMASDVRFQAIPLGGNGFGGVGCMPILTSLHRVD